MSAAYHDPFLINTVGHTVGTLLFGVMIALLIRDWRHNGIRQTRLSLLAAALALFWNLGSLLVLASSRAGQPDTLDTVVNVTFSVLSVLPAVLLQLVLRRSHRVFVAVGYLGSAVAVLLQMLAIGRGSRSLHEAGLLVIAVGFSLLIFALVLLRLRSRRGFTPDAELLSLACLLLFSLSFLHFRHGHSASTWTAEIAWHHAGIPLVLVVLLGDYRFLLLDVFFRFLLNFGLAAAYGAAGLLLYQHFRQALLLPENRFWFGVSLVAACLALISFASVRTRLQQWLTAKLFGRKGAGECALRLSAAAAAAVREEALLGECARILAEWIGAQRYAVESDDAGELASFSTAGDSAWVEAVAPLHFSRGDGCRILLGARAGGRRYLSEDLSALQSLSAVATAQVERFRSDRLHRLVRDAELRALQSQINPHFLFNALNTLYGTIDRRSAQARRFVLNLADIFRYFLHADQTFIRLEEELRIVRAYLEIEQLRLGDRLETHFDVPADVLGTLIPKLSIQPLVENAVKHGVAVRQTPGRVSLTVANSAAGLLITIFDTGPGFSHNEGRKGQGSGVGLVNVRQRLQLCYGEAGRLRIETTGGGTAVTFTVPLDMGSSFRNFDISPDTAAAIAD